MGESWFCRCGSSGIAKNDGVGQKKTIGGQNLKKISKNMFKDASNINRTRSNIRRNLKNYTHSIYYKDHGKKLVSMLLDHYQSQMEWMLSW